MMGSWAIVLRVVGLLTVVLLLAIAGSDAFGGVAPNGMNCCP
jgi:hypothetical protein